MPLETQYISIPLGQGVDQKTDPKLVQEGLLKVENAVMRDTPGQTPSGRKLTMRYGYESLGTDISSGGGISTLGGGEALGVYNDELLLFNKNKVYSRAEFNDSYVDKGSVVPVAISTKAVIRNTASQTYGDMATLNNVGVVAWTDSRGGVRATVYDVQTNNIFQADAVISANGAYARVRAVGSYIFVFFVDTSTNAVKFRRLLISSPFSFVAEQTLIGSTHATEPWYDVEVSGTAFVWCAHLATNTIQIGYCDQTGSTVAAGLPTSVNLAERANNCLSMFVTTDQFVFIFWHNNANGTRVAGYTRNLGTATFGATTVDSTTTPTTLNITAAQVDTNTITCFYEVNNATAYNHYVKKATITAVGVVSGVAVMLRSVGLASKGFTQDNVQYVNVLYGSSVQPTFFTVNSSGTIIAKMGPSIAGSAVQSYLPQIIETESQVWTFTSTRKTQFVNATTSLTGIFRTNLDFGTFDRYYSAQLGENLHITGGLLAQYDGDSVVENGFHIIPEAFSINTSGAGGTLNGTYSLIVVYEWTDRQGQLHRSAPSAAVSTGPLAANSQITSVVIPTLRLTEKKSPRSEIDCVIYMTQASGTIYYRVTTTPLYNDTTADTVSSGAITAAPSTSNELLYTTGGVLENIAPPACNFITALKNRILLTNAEDPNEIWFSKIYSKNEGVAFNDSFVRRLDSLGGEVKGLYPMDDKVIFFKDTHLYFQSGDGPTNTGIQDTFTEPQLIASDVGLKDSNSIALTDQGLVFNSNKGKYLLNRALDLSYIGAPVEALNDLTCTSADLIPSQNQVRFLHSDGSAAVWDTYYNKWYTFTNLSGQDAVIWNGTYHYLRNETGKVFAETPDFYQDENQTIQIVAETPWVKVNGVQGFQRVRRVHVVGDLYSAHTLRLEASYDYNNEVYPVALEFDPTGEITTSVYGTGTYGDEAVYGGVSDGTYQVRAHLPIQKCEAIKFRISNVANSGSGKAMGLSHLQLEVGVKKGNAKLRSGKSI